MLLGVCVCVYVLYNEYLLCPCHCIRRLLQSLLLTPSNQDVPPEIFPLRDEGQGQQRLQVHALHQQPEVIGQDAELEESHGWLARCLERTRQCKVTSPGCLSLLNTKLTHNSGEGSAAGMSKCLFLICQKEAMRSRGDIFLHPFHTPFCHEYIRNDDTYFTLTNLVF